MLTTGSVEKEFLKRFVLPEDEASVRRALVASARERLDVALKGATTDTPPDVLSSMALVNDRLRDPDKLTTGDLRAAYGLTGYLVERIAHPTVIE